MTAITDQIAQHVTMLRKTYPADTATMTDLEIISTIVPAAKVAKAKGGPLDTTRAELDLLRKHSAEAKIKLDEIDARKPETAVERAKRLARINIPSPPAHVGHTSFLQGRMAKAHAEKPASDLMEHKAKMFRAERIEAGKTITAERAYADVYADPANSELQKRVRAEEGRRVD